MAIVSTHVANTSFPRRIGGEPFLIYNVINLADNNSASADVIEALKIAAGTFVHSVWTRIATIEDSTLTFLVGDGADPNGWDATNVNAETLPSDGAMSGVSIAGTDAYGIGKKYTADDTIDLTMSANAGDTAIIVVYALISKDESAS